MLALLCAAPRIDDYEPYDPTSAPAVRPRRASRTLSFIKPAAKRKVSKVVIGSPENFRHEFHLGKDIIAADMWDAARWFDELRAEQHTPSTPSIASSAPPAPATPPRPPATRAEKRMSITPQKRKPVPSLVPDLPTLHPADVALPPSPTDVPLPPSPLVPLLDDAPAPYVTQTAKARWDSAMGEIAHALRSSEA